MGRPSGKPLRRAVIECVIAGPIDSDRTLVAVRIQLFAGCIPCRIDCDMTQQGERRRAWFSELCCNALPEALGTGKQIVDPASWGITVVACPGLGHGQQERGRPRVVAVAFGIAERDVSGPVLPEPTREPPPRSTSSVSESAMLAPQHRVELAAGSVANDVAHLARRPCVHRLSSRCVNDRRQLSPCR